MSQKLSFILSGVIIALLLLPVAAAASGGSYITVMGDPQEYKELRIDTVDALDPMDIAKTLVTLESTTSGDLQAIETPLLGQITRTFDPASGTYHGADVTVTETKTIDGHTIPCHYQVYTQQTLPSFTVKVPGRCGNVLMLKCPENLPGDVNFTELFRAAGKEGYFFAEHGVGYVIGGSKGYHGNVDYNLDNLTYTLLENEVNLEDFCFDASASEDVPRPTAGEYLIAAVQYDSATETMHVLAAMPVLILDKKTPVTWSGDKPYYQDQNKNVTISFGNDIIVDKIAYALVKKETRYALDVKVDTSELAKQPIPTSPIDAITILKNIAGEGVPAEYILTCDNAPGDITYNVNSRLAIVEGYGCSGADEAATVTVAATTLKTLNPGTYYLYALGMNGQKVVAIDQRLVDICTVKPTPTPTGGGGGGGSGGSSGSVTQPPVTYEERGNLNTDGSGIVIQSIVVNAADNVTSLFVPLGVTALDADGNPLTEIAITPLAGDEVPAVPAGAIFEFAGYAYEVTPAGATFSPGITLTMEIPDDVWETLDLNDQQLTVKWYNPESGLWEEIQTTVSPGTRTVTATITHFSTYALFTEAGTTPVTPTETATTVPTTTTPPTGEQPAEGLPMTTIVFAIVIIAIIAAAGYYFLVMKK